MLNRGLAALKAWRESQPKSDSPSPSTGLHIWSHRTDQCTQKKKSEKGCAKVALQLLKRSSSALFRALSDGIVRCTTRPMVQSLTGFPSSAPYLSSADTKRYTMWYERAGKWHGVSLLLQATFCLSDISFLLEAYVGKTQN